MPVAAVIVPCSNRKSKTPTSRSRAVSLPISHQNTLETVWRDRLPKLEIAAAAGDLYTSRGAFLGRKAAQATAAPLYFASAGLGLVRADTWVPSYAMTVSDRGADALVTRVKGRFDGEAWWAAVSAGALATSLADALLPHGYGLVALTQPYAAMLAGALSELPHAIASRLRLFGWRLEETLPASLHQYLVGYDKRLDVLLPGTQTDFSQRALVHFATVVLPRVAGSASVHRSAVADALEGIAIPVRPIRPRVTDDEILAWIANNLPGAGVQRLLRRIRDEGVACEQARFSRLYRRTLELQAFS